MIEKGTLSMSVVKRLRAEDAERAAAAALRGLPYAHLGTTDDRRAVQARMKEWLRREYRDDGEMSARLTESTRAYIREHPEMATKDIAQVLGLRNTTVGVYRGFLKRKQLKGETV